MIGLVVFGSFAASVCIMMMIVFGGHGDLL